MRVAVEPAKRLWTEAELQALREDGHIHEVVDGELVMSPKNNAYHGDVCANLSMALLTYAKARQLGAVWDSSTGFWMLNRNCRAPDVSFVTRERLKNLGFKRTSRKFFPGAPDLAVEILSPGNTRAEIDSRLNDFFASGARIVWIINLDEECAEVCHSPTDRKRLGSGAFLDGEHLLPGFQYPVADLFKDWDWDQV